MHQNCRVPPFWANSTVFEPEENMGKTLIVAEKPSVGRDIAKALEAKTRGNRCLMNDQYVITWAFGHLVTLASPEELDEKYAYLNSG